MDKIEASIFKYALQNAVKFNGKANPGNIIGKVLGENPEMKNNVKELNLKVNEVVAKVNALSPYEQAEELQQLSPEFFEKKKTPRKTGLKDLLNAVSGKVVMRFAPSPSGPLHIGHAYALSLNSEYCRMYDGKLILRIEDTNSSNIYAKAYDYIPEDASWITNNNVSEVYVQSDRLEIYYKYIQQLFDMDKAYVCTCDPEEYKKMMLKSEPCPCRSLSKEDQLQRYSDMFTKYKSGEAVIRIKTDIMHKNPAMRDWPAMRINDSKHPKTGNKYRVWPLMNFSVAIDDHEMGITHTIRAKDHMDNEKRQKYVFDYFGWKMPTHIYVGRINFEDLKLSTSETRLLIEQKQYSGWDDIRLPFLRALKRRGFQPEAFIKYSLDVGVTQNDKSVTKEDFFKAVHHFNKEVLEPSSHRYFFVRDPILIKIENAPKSFIELDLHPDNHKGGRSFEVQDEFYISSEDQIKADTLTRLMDCINFMRTGNAYHFISSDYEDYRTSDNKGKIIHWLPKKSNVKVDVLMPDNITLSGLGEKGLLDLKPGTIVQFERFGFVMIDRTTKTKIHCWYCHT